MGLFDAYSDTMKNIGRFLQPPIPVAMPAPFGILSEAGESITSIFSTIDTIREQGVDGLWNAASDVGEGLAATEFLLSKAKIAKAEILAAGLKSVLGMQYLCGGNAKPEMAEGYSDSAQRFNVVADNLEKAVPNDGWRGPAARAYAEANTSQINRARTMPDIDLDVVMAVSMEANQLHTTRDVLSESATVMGNAIAPVLAMQAIPRYGKLFARTLESGVTGSCMAGCLLHMKHLTEASEKAAQSINDATLLYEELANACYPTSM
ncbi:EspA/EspE family type VII secretion system effector [Mycobacterium sp. DL440]|uniref:EspA/EspE family type VII secretion system effector n=1 Tax=Mycobacterium sp. DL440 TaxID=2675523 RepID=UPI00141D9909|nr:EspA/EspE family type VII secretion system effector [Mycobacterium sp. DL440]